MEDRNIPWQYSWLTPILKKGSKDNVMSYRCINLSTCLEKIMTKIINNRLNSWLEGNHVIHESQIGFRKGHSTLDNIFILREIIQIYNNRKAPLYLCFIDLSKAFDSISKRKLKDKLDNTIPNSRILKLIKNLIDNKRYKILYEGEESDIFTLRNGIPQGVSLSPTLFCIFMNDLLTIMDGNIAILDLTKINEVTITALMYADDILLCSETQDGLIKQIGIVNQYCDDNGLKINYNKTKIMVKNVNTKYSHVNIKHGSSVTAIEIVQEYKYLGMFIANSDRKYIELLENKGKKSSYTTAKTLREFGHVNGKILKDTFEILTLSQMRYCGEFLFYKNLKDLNRIQLQFYKRFCYLKSSTANYCIIGEFGIKPFEFLFYKAAIRLWIKLIDDNQNSLSSKLYQSVFNKVNSREYANTWIHQIRKLLMKLNLSNLWENQLYCNKNKFIKIADERIRCFFREEWINSAKNSHKGNRYLELCRFDNDLKSYLCTASEMSEDMLIMLKFRTGNHKLMAEIGRYGNRRDYEECFCPHCPDEIEDTYHFLVQCSHLSKLRQRYLTEFINTTRTEFNLMLDNSSGVIMKSISMFIKEVNKERAILQC